MAAVPPFPPYYGQGQPPPWWFYASQAPAPPPAPPQQQFIAELDDTHVVRPPLAAEPAEGFQRYQHDSEGGNTEMFELPSEPAKHAKPETQASNAGPVQANPWPFYLPESAQEQKPSMGQNGAAKGHGGSTGQGEVTQANPWAYFGPGPKSSSDQTSTEEGQQIPPIHKPLDECSEKVEVASTPQQSSPEVSISETATTESTKPTAPSIQVNSAPQAAEDSQPPTNVSPSGDTFNIGSMASALHSPLKNQTVPAGQPPAVSQSEVHPRPQQPPPGHLQAYTSPLVAQQTGSTPPESHPAYPQGQDRPASTSGQSPYPTPSTVSSLSPHSQYGAPPQQHFNDVPPNSTLVERPVLSMSPAAPILQPQHSGPSPNQPHSQFPPNSPLPGTAMLYHQPYTNPGQYFQPAGQTPPPSAYLSQSPHGPVGHVPPHVPHVLTVPPPLNQIGPRPDLHQMHNPPGQTSPLDLPSPPPPYDAVVPANNQQPPIRPASAGHAGFQQGPYQPPPAGYAAGPMLSAHPMPGKPYGIPPPLPPRPTTATGMGPGPYPAQPYGPPPMPMNFPPPPPSSLKLDSKLFSISGAKKLFNKTSEAIDQMLDSRYRQHPRPQAGLYYGRPQYVQGPMPGPGPYPSSAHAQGHLAARDGARGVPGEEPQGA